MPHSSCLALHEVNLDFKKVIAKNLKILGLHDKITTTTAINDFRLVTVKMRATNN